MNQIENTITSMEVAEMVGKQHKELLRDIRKYTGVLTSASLRSLDFFIPDEYNDQKNEIRPCYRVTKQGCELIGNKLIGDKGIEFSARYVNRFNEMEEHIISQQFEIPTSPQAALRLMFQYQEQTGQKVEEVENRVVDLEENVVLSAGDYGYITRRINQRVSEVARGFGNINNKQRGELHRDINGGVKKVTGVSTRTQLRQKHFQAVLDYITDWEPSTATKTIVRQMALDLGDCDE